MRALHRTLRRALLPAALAALLAGCATAPKTPVGLPQPRTARADGIAGPVSILIDQHGVPRISAGTDADLAFGLGYMHARDRRFQMELLRMDALGRLRELLGARVPRAVLRLEITSRSLGFDHDAETIFGSLPEDDRVILAAYARGVNSGTAREGRPFEFRLLGYEPEPWTPLDSLAVLQLVSFGFCKNWEQELARLEVIVYQLQKGFTVGHALAVWPPRFDFPPHLIGKKPATDPFESVPVIAPELAEYLTRRFAGEATAWMRPATSLDLGALSNGEERSDAPDPLSSALDLRFLSNNWAVDGSWTGTGKSAFAVDPHVPSSLPPLPYLVSLSLESAVEQGYRVAGASFPGLPAVPFGTNGKVAWGPTSNWADVTDLYVEKPSDSRPGCYQTENGDVPFTTREEVFKVRHQSEFTEETRTVRSTRHGIIVNDFVDRLPADFPLVALARAQTYGRSLQSLHDLYRSSNVAQARAALAGFTSMVGHWVLADADGSIAYTSPVNLPLRRNFLGTVPVPGWNGAYRWDGFVPVDELPRLENPPQGFVATANNQVVQPESTGYPIDFEGDVPFRAQRITSQLAQGRSGSRLVNQMSALQSDGRDNSFPSVRAVIEKGVATLADAPSPLLASAARTLLAWDGNTDPDSPAPTLYQSLLTTLMDVLLAHEVSMSTLGFLRTYFNSDPLLFGILGDPANPAWTDLRELTGQDQTRVVATAFRLSVAALTRRYGPRLTEWTWRRAAPVTLPNALGSVPGLGFLNRGGFAPRGTSSSVWLHKFERRDPAHFPVLDGPGVRFIMDFNDPSRCVVSLPGGQSGRPASRHYGDLLPIFEEGQGVAIELGPEIPADEVEAQLLFVP